MRLRVVWANSNFWTSPIRIGAHHYARLFAEMGWEVAFISDPISPMHFLKRSTWKETRERFKVWRRGGCRDLDGQLFHYTPLTLLPHFNLPILRSNWVMHNWRHLTLPNVRRLLARHGFASPDLLVLDSVNQGFWLDVLQPGKSILRVADDLSGFAGVTASMLQQEQQLMGRVDLVTYTAQRLSAKIAAAHPKAMLHMPNGCDVSHFLNSDAEEPDDLKAIPRPRAIYVGAIDDWFDVDLLAAVARDLSHVSFVIIGPPRIPLDRLRVSPNVHVMGRRDYADVPRYLKNSDVGLIPFRVTEMIQSVHPIKLYEYMACGLPVVSVAWDELESLNSPALLCRSAQEFTRALEGELQQPSPPESYIRYAESSDWRSRLNLLTEFLDRPEGGSLGPNRPCPTRDFHHA